MGLGIIGTLVLENCTINYAILCNLRCDLITCEDFPSSDRLTYAGVRTNLGACHFSMLGIHS